MSRARTIRVDTLTRVEGEGELFVRLEGDRVADVKVRIPEPPRLFEAFLRGRGFAEVPDIVARICGICPVAYQMSAVHAIERIFGVTIDPSVRELRRLLYCAEWIESHALHVYLLHAPDFLDYPDSLQMARDHPALVQKGLELKKTGNDLMTLLGGREIHPVSVRVGGFYRVPSRSELRGFAERLRRARDLAIETVAWVLTFPFPDFERDYEFVALSHPSEYPLNEGRLVSNRGLDIAIEEYEDHFVERHVAHSNALHSTLRLRGSYLTGPLARFNLNFDRLPDSVKRLAREAAFPVPCLNPFRSIVVRSFELLFACEEAIRIVDGYDPPSEPHARVAARAGVGHACTEAPRGILYHRYEIDADGLVVSARIVPPTAQNQGQIEDDLRALVPQILDSGAAEIRHRCEQAVRSYDPCISCATHFLELRIEQTGTPSPRREVSRLDRGNP